MFGLVLVSVLIVTLWQLIVILDLSVRSWVILSIVGERLTLIILVLVRVTVLVSSLLL